MVAEPSSAFVARRAALNFTRRLCWSRRRDWLEGKLAAAFRQIDPLRTILDEAKHLESQALGGGQ